MKKIDDYIEDLRKMFFISVDNDIDKWVRDGKDIYELEFSSNSTNKFIIDLVNYKLKILINLYENGRYIDHELIISDYGWFFGSKDKEVSKYVKKLEQHFIDFDENVKNQESLKILDISFKTLIGKYQKEYDQKTRKEKLEKIEDK